MKIIDNAPIDKPCIGKLIEESCTVGQFADNSIYLIADPETDMAKHVMDYMNQYKQQMDCDDYYYAYELEVVQHVELKNHAKIKECVEQGGDNFLIQLPMLSNDGKKQFIVAHTDDGRLFEDVGLMLYAAERVARQNAVNVLKSYVIEYPDEFVEIARNFVSNKRFIANYFANLADSIMHPTFGMAASTKSIKDRLDIDGIITHKHRMESFDHLLENLKAYRKNKDSRIDAELDVVFKSIDPATWKSFLLKQSPKLQEKVSCYVNPKRLAEASAMDLEIRWSEKIDKMRKNDGHYRLYLSRGDERLMVHFSRSAGFILYLIYLIDRKRNGDKVDTLNIVQYKQLFGRLYEMTYGINGETIFTDMVKNFNAAGEMQQKGLYVVLKSIREDVGNTCERMQEPAEPFLLQDTTAHLAVLPEHIILPDEIMTTI